MRQAIEQPLVRIPRQDELEILAALTRLRQVACDPRLLGLPEGTPVPPSAKLEAFKELMADCVGSGRKVLWCDSKVFAIESLPATIAWLFEEAVQAKISFDIPRRKSSRARVWRPNGTRGGMP